MKLGQKQEDRHPKKYGDANEVWEKIIKDLCESGENCELFGTESLRLDDVIFSLNSPKRPSRLSLIAPWDEHSVDYYLDSLRFQYDQSEYYRVYGFGPERSVNQLEDCIAALRDHRPDKLGIISIFDQQEDNTDDQASTCLFSYRFVAHRGILDCYTDFNLLNMWNYGLLDLIRAIEIFRIVGQRASYHIGKLTVHIAVSFIHMRDLTIIRKSIPKGEK